MNTPSIYKTSNSEQVILSVYDRVLARWPVPYEEMKVSTRHGETSMIVSGDPSAPPVVLVHGSSSNATAWIAEFPALVEQFRVIALDVPGEPGKSAPNRPAWDTPDYADWLWDVLEALEIEKTCLMGISHGGFLSLKFATTFPERVEKLVVLAPGGVIQTRASFLLKAIPLSFFGRKGAEAVNRITFGKQPISEEALEIMNLIMTHFKPRIEPQPIFTDAELQRLTMPVLMIGGTEDALINTQQVAARLDSLLPDVTTRILPDMGHVLVNLSNEYVPFLSAEPVMEPA
jgi:pimeloyl-ACP methyl ester carboxylesterase